MGFIETNKDLIYYGVGLIGIIICIVGTIHTFIYFDKNKEIDENNKNKYYNPVYIIVLGIILMCIPIVFFISEDGRSK
jgi:NADH:ubiquinone oxidoreductase subunit 2 (subunit N)